jgi:hypothetical protein
MKVNVSLKYLALGVATGLFGFSGAALAQASGQQWQLVGVNARLDHSINTSDVRQGDAIEAKLDGSVTTSDGVKLERGTELLGTVAGVTPSSNRGPASLSLLFTAAQLKDGKKVPLKVTLLAAYPATEGQNATYGNSVIAPPQEHVGAQQTILQEPGLLNHVQLQSAVQAQNSGTFSKTDGNFRLDAGTYLQLGVGPDTGSSLAASE